MPDTTSMMKVSAERCRIASFLPFRALFVYPAFEFPAFAVGSTCANSTTTTRASIELKGVQFVDVYTICEYLTSILLASACYS